MPNRGEKRELNKPVLVIRWMELTPASCGSNQPMIEIENCDTEVVKDTSEYEFRFRKKGSSDTLQ
ncbi:MULTISPECIES: hypothetical protein [Paenibacillus]|uniref:Uncharacterized protein n=1 Tax=Paenibacillus amylolyticus TaxID=1451 RepID=A0A1R1C019_PAEAM|nr:MULTISPECIES: hypothetical protein [Paenibacillus]OMF15492.1 hypothetical protein BK131_11550 [Paenibacillus amylolyticus]PRA07893.1 hypothetical protein CQ043_11155 [Paenibacillus sp. MYb63]PRA48030.1 hypothetical protein CQ061_15675 [Paenibacillus sp. MYb67]